MPMGIYQHKKGIHWKMSKKGKENISKGRKGMKFSEEHKKNISKARKGIKLSKETKRKMSEAQSGERGNNWQGGISKTKERKSVWQHRYYIKNKDKIRKKMLENKAKIMEYKKKWERKELENPKFKLNKRIATAIWFALKGKKAGRCWETLVGYILQDLIQHLEKQFDDKMSWQNYGSYWHIDHRTPKSWFKYETAEDEEFKKCWALANLQPMEARENMSKGNKNMEWAKEKDERLGL